MTITETKKSYTRSNANNHKWTEEEQSIIRREYKHTAASLQWLADYLTLFSGDKITTAGVKGQIQRLGIAKSDDRKPWTPEEDEKLRKLLGKHSIRTVAKKMHRCEGSVVNRAKRLHISRRTRDGWFTKREVMAILGHDHKWVQRRIESGALEATFHYDLMPSMNGGSAWHIEEKALVKFIRTYPEELIGCNIDIVMIVDMLAGVINNNHGDAE